MQNLTGNCQRAAIGLRPNFCSRLQMLPKTMSGHCGTTEYSSAAYNQGDCTDTKAL